MKKIINHIHHLIFPNERNNFRAKALHIDALAIYLVFALCVSVLFQFTKDQEGNVLGFATDVKVENLLSLTNEERKKQGLPELSYNESLAQAAVGKAQHMFEQGYWAHYAPDGTTPWSFILSSGYQYEVAGENLAKNFYFSDGVVKAWMESPKHRENILRGDYQEVGFAVVNGVLNGEETTLVVQMFGSPIAEGNENLAASDESQTQPAQEKQGASSLAQNIIPEVAAASADEPVQSERPVRAVQYLPSGDKGSAFSPFKFIYTSKFFFLSLLVLILSVDFYVAVKLNVVRLHGKNLVHLFFLVFIIIGAYFLGKGAIM